MSAILDLLPLQVFPDEWYDPIQTSIAGSAVWVLAFFAISYYLLRWMRNSEKFYAALARQQAAEKGPEMGGGR